MKVQDEAEHVNWDIVGFFTQLSRSFELEPKLGRVGLRNGSYRRQKKERN